MINFQTSSSQPSSKLPAVTEREFRHALSCCAGPVFPTPAVQIFKDGSVQINPADDRCWLGEYTVRQNSTSRWPELTGELSPSAR